MAFWEQVKGWWLGLPVSRRLLLGGGLLAFALTGAIWAVLAQPRYVSLQTGPLLAQDAADVTAKLKELKVTYQLAGDGTTILVPEAERLAARLALAQAGLPRSGGPGYELFDTQKFGATDADRRVEYKRAMEGELARAIMRLGGVQYANVKLALPEQRLFLKEQQPATAAVIVQALAGYQLTAAQVQGIVRFISGSVEGLKAENVTVIDDHGQLLSTLAAGDPAAAGSDRLKAQMAAQDYLQKKVQSLLTPVFGPGNVVAQVAVSLDWDAVTTESTQYTGVQPQSEQVQSKSTTSSTTVPTNQPTAGLVPSYQAGSTGSGSSQGDEKTTILNNAVSSEKTTRVTTPGSVRTLSVGVLINGQPGAGVLSTDQTDQVRHTVAAATGAALADVTITVLPFSQDLVKALLTAPAPPRAGVPTGTLTALALSLGLCALLLLWLRRRSRPASAFGELAAGADVGGMGAQGSGGDDIGQAVAAAAAARAEPEPDLDEMAQQLANAPERSKMRRMIETMIKNNPELVAQLLKGWIGED